MADIIRLLPDALANQIAAGEVIQRPASLVKELMENAVDAKSTHIKLLVKGAGRTLVQVIDNGVGMSAQDARMSFEKHATSKISKVEDLFALSTKGFRGEALASIAAVAQVELKTRQEQDKLGSRIEIEGSKILKQEPCQHPQGTSIAVKNLFFNVPARRNFLKSDNVETKHIIDEFFRIALPHPDIAFSLFLNDHEIYHVKAGNLRQRIVALLGDNYNNRLVPIHEETEVVSISGFIGKPDSAKKTRGEQYIFVNNRFIKSNYLNHAIFKAYEDIISKDKFPLFVLFIDIDPARIDINVHPSKHEIKFDEERLVYTFVNAAARHGLAQYSVTPSLDFDQEDSFTQMGTFGQKDKHFDLDKSAMSFSKTDFPFSAKRKEEEKSNLGKWEDLYQINKEPQAQNLVQKLGQHSVELPIEESLNAHSKSPEKQLSKPYQIHQRYILSPIKSGYILLDQQAAHQRILFERYLHAMNVGKKVSQQQLFPQTLELSGMDAEIMREILADINQLGFEISEFGTNSFVIHSYPADIQFNNETQIIDEFIEQFKNSSGLGKFSKREKVAQSLAFSAGIKAGRNLSVEEMQNLIDELFACENPFTAPNGRKTFIQQDLSELDKQFEK
ncbi:MAG: DNA mismatch repair endonuclease MutL [Bacteroidetes bacterium]|nr:DNA mismatch repair endonuclease MutL [Bacteroidota bacterium]